MPIVDFHMSGGGWLKLPSYCSCQPDGSCVYLHARKTPLQEATDLSGTSAHIFVPIAPVCIQIGNPVFFVLAQKVPMSTLCWSSAAWLSPQMGQHPL